ncbi:uncharacterized protein DUF3987 [Halopolyspora algeriensis]|uniref:Uncharacterized protein DUF3987 n=1 Tax=Halopolyspora algeriensis TaxID=1500506 RepID=A0A368V8G0_9ACTN|nr:DUF3987 domain-containing protein [Halopolyspora algeriensis]RCW37487.1 uncharacterized protein DUF3987 [Halopolyspora algeriensis]TQM42665.1 uncharacterized protein DUF3987 [Halopolyspora algeriensis]TQM46222.1 uncharacterized protein DUF3987 [Halopolyspora algeriensis]
MSKPDTPDQPRGEPGRRLHLVPDPDPTAEPGFTTGTSSPDELHRDRAGDPHPDTPDLPPDPETEQRAWAEIGRARSELPDRDETMFATYLGSVVRDLAPTSEADPANILASLLAATGVYLGPRPHIRAGDDRHPLLIWPLVIGRTSIGRKGAGYSAAKRLLTAADAEFVAANIHSGLTSGEGLAQVFSDDEDDGATGPDETTGTGKTGKPSRARLLPPGDRRLLAFEPEWANVMARMRREGNTLSATLRGAWEGGNLSTLGVNARIVRDTHVGILTHITPGEFKAKVSGSDLAGGTYNRFLPVFVAQTQFLPAGTGASPELLEHLGNDLRTRLDIGARLGQLTFTHDAAYAWRRLYVEFGGHSTDDGPIEQFLSRAAPNCLRVAGIHAALDGTPHIHPEHLAAAAAFIRYAVASARAIFTAASPQRAKLARFIAEAGAQGRARTEISRDCFGGNESKTDIDAWLDQLIERGEITKDIQRPAGGKGGRAKETYIATDAS